MKRLACVLLLPASPALAATGPFFSLGNTDFVVSIAFVIFVAALVHFKAPKFAGRLIDGRIDAIRGQIDNAAQIRADSEAALARTEEINRESAEQAARLLDSARRDAELFAQEAEKAVENTISRRLQAADEQIASAEAAAVAGVRNEAISVAVEVAGQVISEAMNPADRQAIMDRAVEDLRSNLN